jgi:hypothetical protein
MGKRRVGVALAAASLAAFALAACGSSNSNSADEDQITAAITAAATSSDPSVCTKYQTQRFVEQTNSGTGQAAVRSCEKDASNVADKVDVTDISVDGSNATAKAHVTGSIFDGQTLDLALVKENGQWKLDVFKGFENFDKAAYIAAFPAALAKEGNIPPQAVDCLKSSLQATPDQTIENSFVNNDQQAQNQIFEPCAKYFKGG